MSPAFGIRSILLLVIPVGVAAIVLAVMGKRGAGVFKKQGVAWGLTLLMVFAAVGIGWAKAPVVNGGFPGHDQDHRPEAASSLIWDNAQVLSDKTIRTLDQRNERLWDRYQVSISVVTCNYGRDDLGDYALQAAGDMGLGGYDMIVALDISGDNYWLVQGNDLRRDFTDNDCSDYAYDYMERDFARGDYDDAVLSLTKALEAWYGDYYD